MNGQNIGEPQALCRLPFTWKAPLQWKGTTTRGSGQLLSCVKLTVAEGGEPNGIFPLYTVLLYTLPNLREAHLFSSGALARSAMQSCAQGPVSDRATLTAVCDVFGNV